MNVSTINSQPSYQPATPAASAPTQAPAPVSVAGPTPVPTDPPATAGPRFSRDQLAQAVEQANRSLTADGSVRFAVHDGTNRIMVRIVDPKTSEIIREFPDSTFLDMMSKLQELSGMQVDVQT